MIAKTMTLKICLLLCIAAPAAAAEKLIDLSDIAGGVCEGRKGAVVRTFSTGDGKQIAEYKLDSPPVFNGMAAAGGRLYLVTVDGKVRCFGR